MQRFGVWALAAVLVTACGDDDEEKTPVEKCKDLINTFCDRVTSCAEDHELLDDSYSPAELETDCKASIEEELDCQAAVDVGDGYAKCLSSVKTFSCEVSNDALLATPAAIANPPASCMGQILFPRDD
jgi:hypothetical protein